MNLWKYSGLFLILTSILHNIVGFIREWEVLSAIARDGFINSVHDELDRTSAFWFLFSGFVMLLIGMMMHDHIRKTRCPVPSYIAWYLLLISIAGCIMMPVSGFWIVLPQAAIIIVKNRKALHLR